MKSYQNIEKCLKIANIGKKMKNKIGREIYFAIVFLL